MQGIILAILFLLIPFFLVLFLRTNAAILFFVLAGASTLQTYLDKDVASFAGSLFGSGDDTRAVSLVLLALPFAVAAVAFRNSISRSAIFLQLLLSLGVGLCLIFIVPQFLPQSIVNTIYESSAYTTLKPYTSLVIAGTFLASIIMLWVSRPHHEHHKKHGH
jgi:hypothetical protein